MVDFRELLGETSKVKETNPLEIFKRLDKESGKEYLRPHQETILSQWVKKFLDRKDTIVKLHTGQGKTLVGLLMLHSSMNAGSGPAVYLCPNTFLVNQTIKEAKSFGIPIVEFLESGTTPLEFLNSEAILITTCNKLFNGRSIFGVTGSTRDVIKLGSIVMDDAHKCLDIIRDSFTIKINKKHEGEINPVYQKLWNLFEYALMRQAPGTCIDIKDDSDAQITVPSWIWNEKITEILEIIHPHKYDEYMLFVWDLIKNNFLYSTCIFSGKKLEISPRLVPIKMIPSFSDAKRRIFLSATLTEDAFLVRDLDIDTISVNEPLMLDDVKYSGERMILIPTLVSPSLTREEIIKWISRYSEKHGNFGVMSLVPSGKHAENWESEGGIITNVRNLEESITKLKDLIQNESARHVTILLNAYDGIDLPDNVCRILCLDSMPSYVSLNDKYTQEVRPDSYIIRRQLAQKIEQGIGRGIRGPSDWCIVVATGNKLTGFLAETEKNEFLSNETKEQINIAKKLAEKMKEDESGHKLNIIENIINQCVNRDEGWKESYHKKMECIQKTPRNENFLNIFKLERDAEIFFQNRQFQNAADTIQKIIDKTTEDSGWYFQLMSTYLYPLNKSDSMDKQLKAFSENEKLHRPEEGISYEKLANVSDGREIEILRWIKEQKSQNELIFKMINILDSLTFCTTSESFEDGIKQLGLILGFPSQRPEKISGKGPDNLWNITGKQYWIISCKNMINIDRNFISKHEVGQLRNDIAWFSHEYSEFVAKPVFIHPSNTLRFDAFLDTKSYVITPQKLETLKQNTKKFYTSLMSIGKDKITPDIIKQKLSESHLDIFHMNQDYLESISK